MTEHTARQPRQIATVDLRGDILSYVGEFSADFDIDAIVREYASALSALFADGVLVVSANGTIATSAEGGEADAKLRLVAWARGDPDPSLDSIRQARGVFDIDAIVERHLRSYPGP